MKTNKTKRKITRRKKPMETTTEPATATRPVLVNDLSRDPLQEGRKQGLGYGFCKKRDNGSFEVVSPISACKDYLSDVVWAEQTGHSGTWYGFHAKPTGLFNEGVGYLAMTILQYNGGTWSVPRYTDYPDMERDKKTLAKNVGQMQAMANYLEDKMGTNGRTLIEPCEDDRYYLVTIPKYWLGCAPRISLYTLLLRFAMWGFDINSADPWEEMSKNLNNIGTDDSYYVDRVVPKIRQLIGGWRIATRASDSNPHSNGIYNYTMLPPKE